MTRQEELEQAAIELRDYFIKVRRIESLNEFYCPYIRKLMALVWEKENDKSKSN